MLKAIRTVIPAARWVAAASGRRPGGWLNRASDQAIGVAWKLSQTSLRPPGSLAGSEAIAGKIGDAGTFRSVAPGLRRRTQQVAVTASGSAATGRRPWRADRQAGQLAFSANG